MPPVVRVGDLAVDLGQRSVSYVGNELHLTNKEYLTLEILALDRAMTRNSERLVPALRARLAVMKSVIESGSSHDLFVDEDIAFHGTFYEYSENRRLESIWATLRDPVRMIMNLSVHIGPQNWDRILAEHQNIAELVAKGDRKAIRLATQEHFDSALERAREYVRAAESSPSAV